MKYTITNVSKVVSGVTLYQIKALVDFGTVKKDELGGYIEKESNLEQIGNAWVYGNAQVSGNARVYGDTWVSGNAQVYGNAWVYDNAWISAKKAYTKGWFIGGDDTGKITDITTKTGSTYWKAQYVLGDYEIKDIEEIKKEITIDEVVYI